MSAFGGQADIDQFARRVALATGMVGVAGHLATVTSATQNSFLLSIAPSFSTYQGAWLGGQCINAAACSWVTGPLAGQQFSNGQTPVNGAYVNLTALNPIHPAQQAGSI